jgi:hypothetical protein
VCVEHKGADLLFRVELEASEAQRCYFLSKKIIKTSVVIEFEGLIE